MRLSLVTVLTAIFCVYDVYGTLGDFFDNFPSEFGNALSSAWNLVKESIKKPVRIRRLGKGGKRKTTPPTLETVPAAETTLNTLVFNTKIDNKLRLPIIPMPQWRSFDDWIHLQDPIYSTKNNKGTSSTAEIPSETGTWNPISNLDDENNFGVLFLFEENC